LDGQSKPHIYHSKQERYYAQSACSDRQRQADQQAVAMMGDGRTADAGAGWWVWVITSMTTYH